MRKRLFILGISFVASICLISLLYLVSTATLSRPNHFKRYFAPHVIVSTKTINISFNSYYLAGITADSLYLGNTLSALHVLSVDTGLRHASASLLINSDNHSLSRMQLKVAGNNFCLFDLQRFTILAGNIDDRIMRILTDDQQFFSEITPLSANSFIIRTIKNNPLSYTLAKKTVHPAMLQRSDSILQIQKKSLFSTDGMLGYDASSGELVFTYYYRNQFLVMDTNLQIVSRSRLIDTNTIAKIETRSIPNEHVIKIASPPLVVNKQTALGSGHLLVESGLVADNENRKNLGPVSAIDVYDIRKGIYEFSFYLPFYNGFKPSGFLFKDHTLYALHDRFIVAYRLRPAYF